MTSNAKPLLWVSAGPVAFVVAGCFAFLVLGFVLGPGFDIDDQGTPIQKFFGAGALPALYLVAFGGILVSWAFAFATFHRR